MKKNKDLISVIVPIHNVEKYLDRCVEAIINQTYNNLEIILVDDGSTDSSSEICDKWAKRDNRIKVIHKENGGVSSARNVGLDIATGDYIGFVDSDDYIDKEMYKILFDSIKENNSNIAICNYFIIENNNEKKIGIKKIPDDIFEKELLYGDGIKGFNWNKLYSHQLLKETRFDLDVKVWEDLLFNYQMASKNKIIYSYVNKPLYFYIQRKNSALHSSYTVDFTKLKAFQFIIDTLITIDVSLANSQKVIFILMIKNLEFSFRKQKDILKKNNMDFYFEKVKCYLDEGLLKEKIPFNDKIKIIMAVYFPHLYNFIKKLVK